MHSVCASEMLDFSSERGEEDPAKGSENAGLGILSAHFCLYVYANCFLSQYYIGPLSSSSALIP
jgi:hypothetical protein